jgi:hypothetical protein
MNNKIISQKERDKNLSSKLKEQIGELSKENYQEEEYYYYEKNNRLLIN